MIELHELTKDYGTTIAVNKLSLNVAAVKLWLYRTQTAPVKLQPFA